MSDFILLDNLTETDFTEFWCDDGYIFSGIESAYTKGTGNRHDLSDIKKLRDWLDAAIRELEGGQG